MIAWPRYFYLDQTFLFSFLWEGEEKKVKVEDLAKASLRNQLKHIFTR